MLKILLKLTAKTLTLLCISAVFLFFSTLETRAAVGLSVGHNALNLLQTENLFYGNVGSGSHASSSFLLFQNNGSDRLRVDISGNLTTSGAITASAFSGPLTGQLNAANVSSGQFGANVGNGNFSFPGNVGVGTTTPDAKLHLVTTSGGQFPFIAEITGTGANKFIVYPWTDGNTYLQHNGKVIFAPVSSVTGQLTIDTNGNIGIGTNNPGQKLEISGNLKFTSGAYLDSTTTIGSGQNDLIIYAPDYLQINTGYGNVEMNRGLSLHGGISLGGRGNKVVMGGGEDYIWANNITNNVEISSWGNILLGPGSGGTISPKMTLLSSGFVGIGTTTPSAKLYVNGTSIFNDVATFTQPVVVGAPVLNTHAATKNYVDSQISSSTGAIAFWGGAVGSNIWSLNSGNVGIGTTAPGAKLEVSDSVNFGTGSIVYPRITLGNTSGAAIAPSILLRAGSSKYGWGIGAQNFVHDSLEFMRTTSLGGVSYNSPLMVLNSSGNLGVGTTNPVDKLEIIGNQTIKGTGSVGVAGTSTLTFMPTIDGGGSKIQVISNFGPTNSTNYSSGFKFVTANYSPYASVDAMVIRANGNVGIGTTNPTAKLYVNGTSIFNDVATFTQPVVVGAPVLNTHAATKNYVDSQISSSTGAIALWGGAVGSNIWSLNSGNVGLGTTTPATKLQTYGTSNTVRMSYDTTKFGELSTDSSGNNLWHSTGFVQMAGDNSVGDLSGQAGNDLVILGDPSGGAGKGVYLKAWSGAGWRTGIQYLNTAGEPNLILVPNQGNVGIGTMSPNSRLHVYNSAANAEIDVQSLVGAGNHWGLYNNLSDNSFRLWGGSDFMTVLRTSGNVGIGITNPSSQLYVYNDSGIAPVATFDSHYTSSSTFGGIDIFRSGTKAPGEGISYLFSALDNGGARQEYAGIAGQIEANTVNAEQGRMIFFTTDNGATRSEKVRITSNGRVGIGVTNPILALSVDGTSGLPASSGNNQVGSLRLGYAGGGNVLDFGVNVGGTTWLQATTKDDLSRYYSLVLNPNGGNVGIGTTNPTDEFYVNASSIFNDVATFTQPVIVGAPVLSGHAATKNYVDSQISSSTGAIAFWTGSLAGNINSANSGNVGIGTTTPTEKLHVVVSGNGHPTIESASASSYLTLLIKNSSQIWQLGFHGDSSNFRIRNGTTGAYPFVIATSSNIGIGTVSPNSRLHVYSASPNAEIDIQSLVGAGNHWGLYSNLSDNSFRLWGGSDHLTVLRGGNVGVGTSSPATKLDVWGNIYINSATHNNTTTLAFATNGSPYHQIFSNRQTGEFSIRAGVGGSGHYITFGSGDGSEKMRIATTGNVGIGTAAPGAKLHIFNATSTPYKALVLDNDSTVDGSGSIVHFVSSSDENVGAQIAGGRESTGGTSYLKFTNYLNGTGFVERMRISGSGNVGIGTTTPATRLTVIGSGNYSIDAGNYRIGNVATPVSALDAVNKSYLDSAVGTAQNAFWNLSGSNLFASSSSWNVGIGTSSPSTKLDVIGGLRITGPLQLSNVLYMGGGNRVLMVDNAGNVSATSTAPSASTVPVFVGITPSSYNGTSGGNPGYAYANSVCAAAFSGSHVCTTYEMLNTINASSTMPTADAWVHSGPPGYTALANDCNGRRSASSAAYGAYWQMSDSGYLPHGRGLLMTCNNSLQYACCK